MAKASKEEQRKAPILRFKGFTDAWEQRELGNLLKVNSGKDYKHLKKGNIPVYGTSGYMLSVNESLSKNNAIGIGRKGTIDKPQLLKAPFWTVDTLFFLTLKHTNDLNFVYYKLQNINWKKYDESTGVPSLTKNTISKIKINIPELNEQNKIKQLFKFLDNLITLYDRKVKLLSQMKKYFLDNLFAEKEYPNLRFKDFTDAWEQRQLGEVETVNPSSSKLPDYFFYIDLESVQSGILVKESLIKKEDAPSRAQRILKKNDILFQSVRPYQKNNYIVTDDKNSVASTGYIQLRSKNHNQRFIFYFLHNDNFVHSVLQRCTGTTYPAISPKDFSTINVFLSNDKLEEKQIGNFFKILDNLITLYEDKQQHLIEIKKTLLNIMFI